MSAEQAARKRIVAERNRLARKRYRDVRRIRRECFWTRPLGHRWEPKEGRPHEMVCVGCGKEKWID